MSLERIQQAICYMEEHLLEDINYVDVAKSVRISPYDFHRAFSFITGMTANEYIRKRRLARAAQELRETDISVIDAAYKYGYESPESFSKAFSSFHGSTPRQAKQNGARLHVFHPLVIKILLEGGCMIEYRMEHKEGRRFLARVRNFPNEIVDADTKNNHEIPAFWTECHQKDWIRPMTALCKAGQRDLYGLCGSLSESETHFRYGIGVLLSEGTDSAALAQLLQNGYTVWETKPADYAVFKCAGADADCIGETWGRFFKEFCPQTGYTQTEEADYEMYYENGEAGVFCELWIPVGKERA